MKQYGYQIKAWNPYKEYCSKKINKNRKKTFRVIDINFKNVVNW